MTELFDGWRGFWPFINEDLEEHREYYQGVFGGLAGGSAPAVAWYGLSYMTSDVAAGVIALLVVVVGSRLLYRPAK